MSDSGLGYNSWFIPTEGGPHGYDQRLPRPAAVRLGRAAGLWVSGDGINGAFGALNRHEDKIKFVQARHEEEAAFMACAHAKWTGEIGVCIATSGPGAIHLLNGLYDAT
jgi:glyoxylate carboligase